MLRVQVSTAVAVSPGNMKRLVSGALLEASARTTLITVRQRT
jgi:hypothetical protein